MKRELKMNFQYLTNHQSITIRLGLSAVIALVTLVTTTSLPSLRAQDGIGERIGQSLDQGLNRLQGELREGWASLKQTVDRLGIEGRVYSRLRWDKEIATSTIDLDATDKGVVTLRGQVSNAAAKQKAVQLAQDTVGVNRVIDELSVITKE